MASGEPTSFEPARVIDTIGTATVTTAAERMRLSLGIEVRAPGAATALRGVFAKLALLGAVLDGQGVAASMRQTSTLALHEAYRNDGAPDGYQASCQVSVLVADATRAGALIDAALEELGDAIRLHGTTWVPEPAPDAVAAARRAAVADAIEQARQLADAAGVTLGAIVSIGEPGAPDRPPVPLVRHDARLLSARAPDFDPGESVFTVAVRIVHAIGDRA